MGHTLDHNVWATVQNLGQVSRFPFSKEVQLCAVLHDGLSLQVFWDLEKCPAHSEMCSKYKIHSDIVPKKGKIMFLEKCILITPLNDTISDILCLIKT